MKLKALSLIVLSTLVWSMLFVGIAWAHTIRIDPLAPFDPYAPISSNWKDTAGVKYHLSSWYDNGDGWLSPSDIIDLTDDFGTVTYWHVDTVDPWFITSLDQYPEFPLGLAMQVALLGVVVYFGWKAVRKTKL